jgi:CHAT domain-containing protein
LDDEFSPEEELAISRLKTQPLEQKRLAEALSAKSQAGSRPSKPAPSRWISFKKWPVLTYGLATVVLVIAVGLAVFFSPRTESPDNLLAEAYSEQRTLEPRFSGARYGPVRILRGEHGQSSLSKPQALLDAEALIHRHLLKEPNSTLWLDAKGRVDLLEANYDAALQTFQKALDLEPNSARLLTDAASAYFERGQLADRPDDYGQAIELLSRALTANPGDPVALYNRALVNEKMFFYHQALEDWDHYLRTDPTGDWAEEAKRHRDAVRQKLDQQERSSASPLLSPAEFVRESRARGQGFSGVVDLRAEDYLDQAVREWLPAAFQQADAEVRNSAVVALRTLSEILLKRHGDHWLLDFAGRLDSVPKMARTQVSAVQLLAAAVKANSAGNFAIGRDSSMQAAQLFAQARNQAGELRARFETLYALHLSNQEAVRCLAGARSMATQLAGHHYPWVEAQMYVEMWNCQGQLGHFREAQPDLAKALVIADGAGYGTLKLRVLGVAAAEQYQKGNIPNALLLDHQGLARYCDGVYPPYRGYQFYSDIAFLAENTGSWNLALASAKEALSTILLAKRPLPEMTARYNLARYALATGDAVLAESQSNEANRLFAGLPQDDVIRSYEADQEIQLANVEAQRRQIDRSWAHLSRARAQLPTIKNYFIALRFFKTSSALQLLKGDPAEAERDLVSAVAVAEWGLNSLRDERDRSRWARETGEAYRRLAQIRWESGEGSTALNIWEWYRGAPVRKAAHRSPVADVNFASLGTPPISEIPDVSQSLPALDRETIVTYLQLPTKLIIWAFDDRGVIAKWTASTPEELERLGRRFRDECSHPDSDPALLRRDGRELYDLLLAPIADRLSPQRTLVIETDEALGEVPFGALIDPAGRYVAESYETVLSPGLLYRGRLRASENFSREQRALIVGAPAISGDLAENLQPLEDAAREARDIALRFKAGVLLTGTSATLERVEQELSRAAIFHFAGHALVAQGKPVLLLANLHPSSETAILDPEQLSPEKLRGIQLVVLSSCSTTRDQKGSLDHPETLVRVFFHAGVPFVVAARWSVDSSSTAEFMQSFYRALLNGQSVSSSLRTARAELHSLPATAHPYYWAAFEGFGRR